jgi:hypothetical protein
MTEGGSERNKILEYRASCIYIACQNRVYRGGLQAKVTPEVTPDSYNAERTTEKKRKESNTKKRKEKNIYIYTEQTRKGEDIVNKYIRKEYKDIYVYLLNHWNSKKNIVHKYLTDATYGVINAKLDNGYTKQELALAIDNYDHILKGKQYFWTYKWTLIEFLKRGLDKFMDLEIAKKNYADKFREDDDLDQFKAKHRG